MPWLEMFRDMLNSGTTMDVINAKIKLYTRYNIIKQADKISIYATLMFEGFFTTIGLNTYVTQGYITEQEKLDIIALNATY
jgi:hypothetical protein